MEGFVLAEREISCKEIVTSSRFWLLYALNFCTVFYGYLLLSTYKMFAVMYINDDIFITFVGSIAFILGALRFVWSMLLDKGYSYHQVYGTLILIQIICSSLIIRSAEQKSKGIFLLLTSLSIFCEGGHFVLLPSHCAQVYHSSKKGVKVYSLLVSCFGLSSICGSLFTSLMLETFSKRVAFEYTFAVACAMNIIAIPLLISYSKIIN